MDELKTDKGVFSPEDFLIWEAGGILDITPKFQRRGVWRPAIKSFFIDTLLRGMTVPPIYLRITQNETKTKSIRQVVDGQQRIRAVMDFIKDKGYRLSKNLNSPWAKKRFAELTEDQQQKIKNFGFSTEVFKGISDQQVLEVFCRLNMYGVPLNAQELRNGEYFGVFKQLSLDLALAYLEAWRSHRVFTEQSIARMLEVELTSELLIAGSEGMQDKKKSIGDYYRLWDDEYPNCDREEKRFKDIMATISETFPEGGLMDTEFRKPQMFYTLYCVIYHHVHGLPKVAHPSPKKKLTSDDRDSLKEAVIKLSEIIQKSKEDKAYAVPSKYKTFVTAASGQTDNINPRKDRFNALFEAAF